jgi:lipopolysaccharide/colanic/teichoic acid biosynthesis glycosyltransferase
MSTLQYENIRLVAQRKRWSLAMKRALDIFISSVALVLLSPTFLILAIAIKLQDGGPILHRRRMLGANGEFHLFKFRSMCINADDILRRDPELMAEFKKNYKLVNDPRVTRLGRFIRRTSLDELPQLFNVLIGEMSLVGPRSITREELAKYGELSHVLLLMKPGLSGYWQTEGRQTVSYQERVRMDIHYVQNWSLIWDIKILCKTPSVVLKGVGAY